MKPPETGTENDDPDKEILAAFGCFQRLLCELTKNGFSPDRLWRGVLRSLGLRPSKLQLISVFSIFILFFFGNSGTASAQIPDDYIGAWKLANVARKGKKMFQLRTELIFCEDSTVISSTYSKFTEEATRKIGVVRKWGADKIEVEYSEIWYLPDTKDEYEFKTFYTELEYFFIKEKNRSKATLSFSRLPEIPDKNEFEIRRVSSSGMCPEMEKTDSGYSQ